MANLTRKWTWKKWAPDLGENREGETPLLFLELATGLTPAQMQEIATGLQRARELRPVTPDLVGMEPAAAIEAIRASTKAFLADLRKVMVDALGPYVRVHGGPHTVDGKPLATLADYLELVEDSGDLGVNARAELESALSRFNSIEGPDELFSLRRSGGARSTDARSTVKAASPTASR